MVRMFGPINETHYVNLSLEALKTWQHHFPCERCPTPEERRLLQFRVVVGFARTSSVGIWRVVGSRVVGLLNAKRRHNLDLRLPSFKGNSLLVALR